LIDAYSPFKATRHLDIIQAVRRGAPARPAHVQIVLSDLCNQACGFCAYRDPTYSSSQLFYEIKVHGAGLRKDVDHPERNYNPNRMIPFAKVIEILDDCQAIGVQAVQFTGGGEPTVHPQWVDALLAAQERGLKTSLVTNGVNLAKSERGIKAAAGCEWVRVSVDAGSPETYTKIRNVPAWHYDAAWDSVEALSGAGLVVGVGFVVTPGNWHEIYDAAEAARDAGASNIRISAQFSAQDEALFAEIHDEAAELARRATDLSRAGFEVINRFSEKLGDLKQKAPDYDTCGYQQFTTYIGADLNVYRCCVLAYNEDGVVGNLRDRRFADLWMSQERAEEMAAFSARSCDRCQFNSQNRLLDYVLRPEDPPHSEFV
jgi:Fe-coproporphyrin III synthase